VGSRRNSVLLKHSRDFRFPDPAATKKRLVRHVNDWQVLLHKRCNTHKARREQRSCPTNICFLTTATLLLFISLGLNLHLFADSTHLAEPQRQKAEILFLSSLDPDLPDIDAFIEEAETEILESRSTPVHFNLEYLGPTLAIEDSHYRAALLELLQAKYRGRHIDLVIAIGDRTLEFARTARRKLFPGMPILFFLSRAEDSIQSAAREPGETGVIRKLNFLPTLKVALNQNAGTRHVIIICGSSDFERLEMAAAREQFRAYESDIDVQYWAGISFQELSGRIAGLDPSSVVLFLDFLEDPDGEQFSPSSVLRMITRTSTRPVYGTLTSYMGSGIVGGSLADLREAGGTLGRSSAHVLSGQRPENIPITSGEFQRYVFDWRQLHRFGISNERLPTGSSVLFEQNSSRQLYDGRIVGLALLVVGVCTLLVLLFVSYGKRRRLEAALRQRQADRKPKDASSTKAGDANLARVDLSGQLIHAQEEERARIARELHDDINQRLALLANGLAELERKASETEQHLPEKEVRALWRLTNEIAGDIQHLSHQLHPSKLHYLGLGAAVRDLCQEFSRQYKIEIECVVRDIPRSLNEDVSLSLFRTVQESLHNAARHSHAPLVRVELTGQGDFVRLRVSDDGIGFETNQKRHQGLGLISIRERVSLVGGELTVWSRPSLGTQIEARVPLATKQSSVPEEGPLPVSSQ
jgi:signal transduction histidine kinase